MLQTRTVEPGTLGLLKSLMTLEALRLFYLVGGTLFFTLRSALSPIWKSAVRRRSGDRRYLGVKEAIRYLPKGAWARVM